MSVEEIVDKYFPKIELEDTDYVIVDDAKSDAAYILLQVPRAMLREYLALKGQSKDLPDPVEFWQDSNLVKKLRGSDKYHGQGHEHLVDMLDFLGGEVTAYYQALHNSDMMRLAITEVPEFYDG